MRTLEVELLDPEGRSELWRIKRGNSLSTNIHNVPIRIVYHDNLLIVKSSKFEPYVQTIDGDTYIKAQLEFNKIKKHPRRKLNL